MTALRSATIAAVVGTVLALMAPAKTLFAQGGGNPNPGVLPPNSSPFGRTYPEWSAAWLQWAFSQPVSTNPNFDPTGALANNAQSGPVFFLASVINLSGTVERNFSVPAGRAIFFLITTIEGDNACVEPPLTVDQLRAGGRPLFLQLKCTGRAMPPDRTTARVRSARKDDARRRLAAHAEVFSNGVRLSPKA